MDLEGVCLRLRNSIIHDVAKAIDEQGEMDANVYTFSKPWTASCTKNSVQVLLSDGVYTIMSHE